MRREDGVPAKNSIDRKERLIHGGVKRSRELLSGLGLQISWTYELREVPVPSRPESSRTSADSSRSAFNAPAKSAFWTDGHSEKIVGSDSARTTNMTPELARSAAVPVSFHRRPRFRALSSPPLEGHLSPSRYFNSLPKLLSLHFRLNPG
jgi:hypothetical protein